MVLIPGWGLLIPYQACGTALESPTMDVLEGTDLLENLWGQGGSSQF